MNTSGLLLKGRYPLQVRWQFLAGRGFTSLWQHGRNNPNIVQFVIQRRKYRLWPELKKIIGNAATTKKKGGKKIIRKLTWM